jgi:hypothetical protein
MRPSLRASWQNFWQSDMPFVARCQVAFKNNAIKMRTRQNCCGHPGEPGC